MLAGLKGSDADAACLSLLDGELLESAPQFYCNGGVLSFPKEAAKLLD
jgi:hypothetical protein